MGQFVGDVELTPLTDGTGRNWRIDAAFAYKAENGDAVSIPAGFVTDLASVPRALWVFWPPEGRYTEAAIVHDWCYRNLLFPRKRCDDILLEAMKDSGVPWYDRDPIYWGVRAGGWVTYDGYVKKRRLQDGGNSSSLGGVRTGTGADGQPAG